MKVSYLTPSEKETELARLGLLIPGANHRHDDGLDAGMVPWLERFNDLPGVVTIQSCEGHVYRWHGHRYVNWAYVAFRYSRGTGLRMRWCWETIPELPQAAHLSINLRERDRTGRREEWLMIWFRGRSQRKSLEPVLGPFLGWLGAVVTK